MDHLYLHALILLETCYKFRFPKGMDNLHYISNYTLTPLLLHRIVIMGFFSFLFYSGLHRSSKVYFMMMYKTSKFHLYKPNYRCLNTHEYKPKV